MRHILTSKPLIHLFALAAICLAVFAGTLANDFVWEDLELVAGNSHIRDYRNIPLFFTADHWRERGPGAPDAGFRPIRETSFAVDYLLWGRNPGGFHLTNLLLHLTNVVLVYFLVLTLTAADRGNSRPEDVVWPGYLSPAFLTALFFALHPVHVESVSYIKNRSDPLAFIFFQGACLLFIVRYSRAMKNGGPLYYVGALACFLLALGSKPMAATLPLVLVLYVVCFPDEQPLSKRLIRILPFFGLVLVYCLFQKGFLLAAGSGTTGFTSGSWRHLWAIVTTLGWYLDMLVWPAPLSIYHVFHPPAALPNAAVLLSLAALMAIFVLLIKTAASQRLLLFGLAWILITLMPVANIFVLEFRPIAEQRLYIPSFGFCLVLALIITRMSALTARIGYGRAAASWPPYVITGIVCAAYAVITIQRNFEWRDSVSLFSSTVNRSPDLAWAHNNLGLALKEKGRLDEAISHYQTALTLKPRQSAAYNAIGAILGEKGQLDEAVHYFETALQIRPGFALAHENLGLVFSRQGRLEEAVYQYQMALTLEPENALVHSRLGAALLGKSDPAGACRHFVRAWEIDPATFVIPADCRR